MFETLGKKIGDVFQRLKGKGVLTESDVLVALREIRVALLEADVALPALKSFIEHVKEKAIGENVLKSITPVQMVIKFVHEELISLLSHPDQELKLRKNEPTIFLMVGLQGSGKTSMSGKLAFLLKERKKKVLLASLDIYRPAAQHQLEVIGRSIDVPTLEIISGQSPLDIAKRSLTLLPRYDVLILDTAGRLHIDQELMGELQDIKALTKPHEILLVADALSGQDTVRTAQAFQEDVGLTGICLSRVDGDGRGGAALSLRYCTGCPIKVMGVGELPPQVVPFEAQRLADRILDRGDVVGLVEKAAKLMNTQEEDLKRLQKGVFTLEDLAKKIKQIEAMGGIKGILDFLPGVHALKQNMQGHIEKTNFKRQLAIISSMTVKERRLPSILNASRKRRIAKGSGTSIPEINRLLDQFQQMQKMVKQFKGKRFGL